MTLREVAKQALEALVWEVGSEPSMYAAQTARAITALRAALAEPDGWRQCAKGQRTTQFCGLLEEAVKAEREQCAALAARIIGGYDQIADYCQKYGADLRGYGWLAREVANAIRAKANNVSR